MKRIINKKVLLCTITMLGLFALFYFNMKDKINTNNASTNYTYKYIIYGLMTVVIMALLLIFIHKTKSKKIHVLFVIVSLTIGFIYIFSMPLFSQSDEVSHYLKAYSVAMGRLNFNGKNGNTDYMYPEIVKKSVYYNVDANKNREYKSYEDMDMIKSFDPNYESNKFVKIDSWVANYPSVNYLPHVIGMKIGMLLKLNSYYIGILGRITNLIICTLLLALGLKWLPYKKNAALILLLSPVVISYNAAFSIDGAILCYSFLFISYILKLRSEKKPLNIKSLLLLSILTILISITKFAYCPIIACILLIPKECFNNNKVRKILFCFFELLLGAIFAYLCLIMMNTGITSEAKYVNSWIYKYPVRLLYVFINDTFLHGYDYISNIFAGHYLCHNQLDVYPLISFIYILLFFVSLFSDEIKEKFKTIEKMLILLIILGVYFMLFFAMYMANTPYNSSFALGVQGRYFTPIMILLIILFSNKNNSISTKKFISISILLNLSIVLTMIVKFMFFVY